MSLDEVAPPDTPDDHLVIGLEIEVALLPEWFDAIRELAGEFARRMTVMEHPEAWRLKIEIPRARADEFRARLTSSWAEFVEERRAQGRWT